jgi:hypothetical protein
MTQPTTRLITTTTVFFLSFCYTGVEHWAITRGWYGTAVCTKAYTGAQHHKKFREGMESAI